MTAVLLDTLIPVISANAGNGTLEEVSADAARFRRIGKVILWQEFADRKKVRHPGWERYSGGGYPGAASTPIDYDPDIFVDGTVTTGSVFVSGRTRVPERIPGPSLTKPKRLNWVRGQLEDNGRWVRFCNFHGAVSPHSNPISERLGDLQVDTLAELFDVTWKGEGLIVFGGDLNRDIPNDPDIDRIEAADMVWLETGPTHGPKKTYDGIFYLDRGDRDHRVTPMGARTLRTSSDHKAVLGLLEFAAA